MKLKTHINMWTHATQVTERILDVVKNFDKVEPSKVREGLHAVC
jgi:hypothetical protein